MIAHRLMNSLLNLKITCMPKECKAKEDNGAFRFVFVLLIDGHLIAQSVPFEIAVTFVPLHFIL